MLDTSDKTVEALVFEMEDDISSARDWANVLYDRLSDVRPMSKAELGRYSRVAGELVSACENTSEAYNELFEATRQPKPAAKAVRS